MERVAMISVGRLEPGDREAWERLFRGYVQFYQRSEPDEMYDGAWLEVTADTRVHALGARLDGQLAGITHFMTHPNSSGADWCLLQDLFTAPEARGRGAGRALILAVADWARQRGCGRLYWHTQSTNATARRLYDSVAENRDYIRYQLDL